MDFNTSEIKLNRYLTKARHLNEQYKSNDIPLALFMRDVGFLQGYAHINCTPHHYGQFCQYTDLLLGSVPLVFDITFKK